MRALVAARWMIAALLCPMLTSGSGFVTVERADGTKFDVAQSIAPPTIDALSPASGPLGTLVTIRGSNFTPDDNFILFQGAKSFAAGSPVHSVTNTSLQFLVTTCPSRQPQCPGFYPPAGNYSVAVKNENGISNGATFVLISPPARPE
jgi:IPT/TIG domain